MPLSPQEKDNLTRWDGRSAPYFEAYDLSWTDPSSGIAGSFRYELEVLTGAEPVFTVTADFFDFSHPEKSTACSQRFSLGDARIEREIFYFSAGPSAIFESGARGDLPGEGGRVSWELKFQEEGLSLRHLPSPFYFGNFPKTKILAPHLSFPLSGEFSVNDRKILIENVPARQAHLWGSRRPTSWVLAHCNAFEEDRGFCFEGLSTPPFHLFFFYWDGKLHRFNSPWRWWTNRSRPGPDRWHFDVGNMSLRFVGDLFSSSTAMGGRSADMTLQILRKSRAGWESVKKLTASKTAFFEWMEKDPRKIPR